MLSIFFLFNFFELIVDFNVFNFCCTAKWFYTHTHIYMYICVQLHSVAQSSPTLRKPMDFSTPGLPVHHQLLELAQTRVHWVNHTIQPSLPSSPHGKTWAVPIWYPPISTRKLWAFFQVKLHEVWYIFIIVYLDHLACIKWCCSSY